MRRVKRDGGTTYQLHAPAALSMGKKPPGLPGDKVGRPQNRSKQKRTISVPARIQTTNLQPCSF